MGKSPVLIVVDVTMGFCGSPGLALHEAIEQYSSACGPASWEAMPRIAALIDLFRAKGWPVVYTLSDANSTPYTGRATKRSRTTNVGYKPGFNDFPAEIAPNENEWVLAKTKASAFFHTPLPVYLNRLGVDTAVICGVSTSGCVRATTVDACSYGYYTFVVDDCCFDRSHFAHCANLFDMNAKYATTVSLEELSALVEPPEGAVSIRTKA